MIDANIKHITIITTIIEIKLLFLFPIGHLVKHNLIFAVIPLAQLSVFFPILSILYHLFCDSNTILIKIFKMIIIRY